MEATKALSNQPKPDDEEVHLPKQKGGHDESHVIVVVCVICSHAYSPEEIRCFDNIGDNTQIITEQGGAHATVS